MARRQISILKERKLGLEAQVLLMDELGKVLKHGSKASKDCYELKRLTLEISLGEVDELIAQTEVFKEPPGMFKVEVEEMGTGEAVVGKPDGIFNEDGKKVSDEEVASFGKDKKEEHVDSQAKYEDGESKNRVEGVGTDSLKKNK